MLARDAVRPSASTPTAAIRLSDESDEMLLKSLIPGVTKRSSARSTPAPDPL